MNDDHEHQLPDLHSLSMQQLLDELDIVEQRLTEISAQLDAATAKLNATGEYSDPAWYARARAAKRFTGATHQRLLRHIAERRRKEERSVEAMFLLLARERVDPVLFAAIMEDAQARVMSSGG